MELYNYIQNPYDSQAAFNLANWYYDQGQTAAALNFYLRVTEIDDKTALTYESLVRAGLCLRQQGNRIYSMKSFFLHAISICPHKPHAYFLLAQAYEENKEWQECHTISMIGLKQVMGMYTDTSVDLKYPGVYGFQMEIAIALWWMGRIDESLELFLHLNKEVDMLPEHAELVKNNIKMIWGTDDWAVPSYFKPSMELKLDFRQSYKVKKNYSQAYQDIFILTMLDGKREGKYLEIGSHEPIAHSNTYLLEKEFNWKGVSLEIDTNLVSKFNGTRVNKCITMDATIANYNEIMDGRGWGTDWDYLQLDCEPANNTYLALLGIPFDKYRFAVITYEHDHYCDESKIYRERSRRYLKSMGYELVGANISVDEKSPFEDWWIHPELVEESRWKFLRDIDKEVLKAESFLIK